MALIAPEGAVWEYQTAALVAPADPSAVVIPTEGWTAGGIAPFGHTESAEGEVLPYPIATDWPLDTGLWIRRNVTTDGIRGIKISGGIEQALWLYFDGVYVGAVNPTNVNTTDVVFWSMAIPPSLATEGTHEIAIFCIEDGNIAGADFCYVSVEADYIPIVMPFQPRAPVKETLAWLTDVQTSKDGTEERGQFRLKPRQSFEFSYPVDSDAKRKALNLVYGRRHDQWAIPIWTQAQRVGAVAQGARSVAALTDHYEFVLQGLAMLWQSHDNYQIITVRSLTGSSLGFFNLAAPFDDAWLMPVRVGFMPNNPTKAFDGHKAEHRITFQVEDSLALEVAEPDQYESDDIYFEPGLLSGDALTDDIVGQLDLQDEALGVVKYYAPWLNTKIARTHRALAEGAEEAWELREWLYRRAGRFRGFWQPSFESDIKPLNTGTITDTITMPLDLYQEHGEQRTRIAVETTSGWLVRQILSTLVTGPDQLQLTLDSALNIPARSVKSISWLGYKRLNTDSVDLSWPGAGVCEIDVRLLELYP